MGDRAEKSFFGSASTGLTQTYSVNYQFNPSGPIGVVKSVSLPELLSRYVDILWEPGSHKKNVTSFIGELDEILLGQGFEVFTDQMVDTLIGELRKRGNSNATINRKMAALSKLLRKAFKMGDLHSLPEFRRQKERSGRIRFLDFQEEDRLFSAIRGKDEGYANLLRLPGRYRGQAGRGHWTSME